MPDLIEQSDALLSPCGRYRYWLTRSWDASLPQLVWVMLNPSTADASLDDPTIRRVRSFTAREGCGSFCVLNLFAFRATKPNDVWRAGADAIGPENGRYIADLTWGRPVVCAWGADPNASKRAREVAIVVRHRAMTTYCLGLTQKGAPRHPLFARGDAKMVPYLGD